MHIVQIYVCRHTHKINLFKKYNKLDVEVDN